MTENGNGMVINSYTDGYSRGYLEALSKMNQGNNGEISGHYPTINPYYPDQRHW